MSAPAARVGKRQVRPNLSRTDFGYTERPRVPVQKAAKKPKRADEEDEPGSATADRPLRTDKDSRSLVRRARAWRAARPPLVPGQDPCLALRR